MEALRDASTFVPELPQADAFDTLGRVRDYERALVQSDDVQCVSLRQAHYAEGSATTPDELSIFNAQGTVLASADHATDPVRKATGVREGADHGTAGLVRLLAERDDATALIPIGKQTGNAAVTPNHPVKAAMSELLPGKQGFLSVHGMRHSKLTGLNDRTEIHAIIGLGKTPNEQSRAAAEELIVAARELGLRAIIGNDIRYKTYDFGTQGFELDAESGEPKLGRLAALGAGSTTNHAYCVMDNDLNQVPAFQVEMTRLLRLIPEDMESGWHQTETARAMGVHLGYLLMHAATEIIKRPHN